MAERFPVALLDRFLSHDPELRLGLRSQSPPKEAGDGLPLADEEAEPRPRRRQKRLRPRERLLGGFPVANVNGVLRLELEQVSLEQGEILRGGLLEQLADEQARLRGASLEGQARREIHAGDELQVTFGARVSQEGLEQRNGRAVIPQRDLGERLVE